MQKLYLALHLSLGQLRQLQYAFRIVAIVWNQEDNVGQRFY